MRSHVGGQIEFGRIFYPHLIKCAEKARLIQALQFVLQYFAQYRFNKTIPVCLRGWETPFILLQLHYLSHVSRMSLILNDYIS
jgi:hypothetical protein